MSSAPASKRPRREVSFNGNRSLRKRRSSVPRSLKSRAVNGRNIHCLSGDVIAGLDADLAMSFCWDTAGAHIQRTGVAGSTTFTVPGLTELGSVYEMIRLAKVEFTILPPANTLDYSTQVNSTTRRIIPIVYMAPDYNDAGLPTKEAMLQEPALKTTLLNKVLRASIYPKLEGSNGLIDVGSNQKNIFMQASLVSTQKWHGYKIFFDMNSVYLPDSLVTIQYKLYWECMHTK